MAGMACPKCGSVIEAEGLVPSLGGYNLYCVVCGHTWHV